MGKQGTWVHNSSGRYGNESENPISKLLKKHISSQVTEDTPSYNYTLSNVREITLIGIDLPKEKLESKTAIISSTLQISQTAMKKFEFELKYVEKVNLDPTGGAKKSASGLRNINPEGYVDTITYQATLTIDSNSKAPSLLRKLPFSPFRYSLKWEKIPPHHYH
ncbi:hypothetical protein [Fangia hongkongensis]|uniref:hypothetical protein n=1 Tax=Fangia hongkongensis TaxID=270495 RepID=UPI001F29AE04|nr:hypothetical protein [Fangia hongkongensis]MBK2124340.1 hypothetical protein [Fangia hongkongensis]